MRSLLSGALAALMLAAPAQAATWVVDKAKSSLGFRGQVSGTPFTGRFESWDAQISFDPANLAASRAVVTVNLASADTGDRDRDDLLPTPSFFNTARFPRATFVTRRFVDKGGGRYEAVGDLTLKGVTRPVTLPFTLAITGNTAQMTGAVALNRGAFGVGSGQWASDETIDSTVQVTVRLTATRR